MSSDTAKEDASVVDSSVTEWKHGMDIFDDPETPSYKANKDGYPSGADEQVNPCDQVGNSSGINKGKLYGTRYFIIKSLNHQNIQLSTEKGVWATQVMNEPILEEAFNNSGKVILIFSVNMSGFFQGYAQMISSIGWRRDNVWSQGSSGNNPWGRSFKVKWLRLHDLPFQSTLHLKNPLNQYKPVKISRDCQELPQDIGEALCELLDGRFDVDSMQNRDNLHLRRPCIDSPCTLQNDVYDVPPMHITWPGAPMLYPSFLYQNQTEANRFHLTHQGSSGMFLPDNFPITSGASKVSWTNDSHLNGSHTSLKMDRDKSSQPDVWGFSAERSPLDRTLTEDDILDMSYEEYLEVHSRSNKKLYHHAAGPSRRSQESISKEHSDDSYSNRRTHHPSRK